MLYQPPIHSGSPHGVIMLFDDHTWLHRLRLAEVLNKAIATGELPPVAVGLATKSVANRKYPLSANAVFLRDIAGSVLPWSRREFGAERGTGRVWVRPPRS